MSTYKPIEVGSHVRVANWNNSFHGETGMVEVEEPGSIPIFGVRLDSRKDEAPAFNVLFYFSESELEVLEAH